MAEIIRVSIGSEPMQKVPALVLQHSIRSRTKAEVQFTSSWDAKTGWHPLLDRQTTIKGGTAFALWRWIVPQLYGEGKAIYLDADQVCLGDIADLWNLLPADRTIAAVCNAVGFFGAKVPELGKTQTSVMVMNCEALRGRARIALQEAAKAGKLKYRDLMQATWLPIEEIAELPPGWNHFGISTPETRIIHFSHVASQPWWNPKHPTKDVWYTALKDAVKAGTVTPQELADALAAGHLDGYYIKRLRRDIDGANI